MQTLPGESDADGATFKGFTPIGPEFLRQLDAADRVAKVLGDA